MTTRQLALGCMAMSGSYAPTSDAEGIATIHEALDRGITLIDTGDFYGAGHNELLIGRAIRDRRDQVRLSVKFGALRAPNGMFLGFDGRPAAVKNSLAYSLTRLGVDHIDIYRPARLDPSVPIEETVGAIGEMIDAGYVREVGLSEVGVDAIRRAHAVRPVHDLQIEYSIISRGPEQKIFPALDDLGIRVTAYGLLSRGLLSGSKPTAPTDFRRHLPRFAGDNLTRNQQLVDVLRQLASEKNVTPSQLAIAWVLAKSPNIIPLLGPRTPEQLRDSLGALDVELTANDVSRIENAVPEAAGTRYDERQMAILDSER
jgi:aryl-alcohol dehydrogenase-like predicted oxidoreductase